MNELDGRLTFAGLDEPDAVAITSALRKAYTWGYLDCALDMRAQRVLEGAEEPVVFDEKQFEAGAGMKDADVWAKRYGGS